MLAFDLEGRLCSFCGETRQADDGFGGLQSGYGALICGPCVDGYHALSTASSEPQPADPWAEQSAQELLSHLQLIVSTKRQVDDFLQAYVAMLRERRLSWASIGGALGVSRQAAWERFSQPRA